MNPQLRGHSQAASRPGEPAVSGPETLASETHRRQEMDIDPPQAAAHQDVGLDEGQGFFVVHRWSVRKAS